jgi:hypothetical protein
MAMTDAEIESELTALDNHRAASRAWSHHMKRIHFQGDFRIWLSTIGHKTLDGAESALVVGALLMLGHWKGAFMTP